ncbi:hypothetical protein B0T25DRAFT_121539 [Lasiosphaeria hispida]|uniref:Uncharacterized protein n=1 Tax=Lasiosphaeria hispida TaxID=260671 RepID=A0AAJ0HRS4_9PEZI|nr:hypothetical protein B0T25DRAFT_121539 [Lasiosphaeria hispida]
MLPSQPCKSARAATWTLPSLPGGRTAHPGSASELDLSSPARGAQSLGCFCCRAALPRRVCQAQNNSLQISSSRSLCPSQSPLSSTSRLLATAVSSQQRSIVVGSSASPAIHHRIFPHGSPAARYLLRAHARSLRDCALAAIGTHRYRGHIAQIRALGIRGKPCSLVFRWPSVLPCCLPRAYQTRMAHGSTAVILFPLSRLLFRFL